MFSEEDMSGRTKPRMSVFLGRSSSAAAPCLETTSRFVSRCLSSSTRIHIMALDGIVNVNSLFTVALFLGLAASPADPRAAHQLFGDSASCRPGTAVAEGLVAFHVYSFSSFLFSSLVALGLKQAIKISSAAEEQGGEGDCGDGEEAHGGAATGHVNTAAFRAGMAVSALGSVAGSGFLMMALVNLVQMKLGTLGCGESGHSVAAVVPLVVLVPLGLVVYLCLAIYAFTL
ncbi:uncharacterized protein LOC125316238 [Rhodamnia argentea]|uniref:Uncharacterized protein LOC125316238 n=1 Tax=Rhodamnia argentea TaxID=178133 RepID=A0ABM3HTX8_9MYRT|nr:uncharacterized protein LOC125316238 [Rhodamnia argentea]